MSRTVAGVAVSSVETELFDNCGVTKGELIDYLEAMADQLIAELSDRALSVVRARPGSDPFMQKNLPKYAPDWIAATSVWAESSQRTVRYPLANDTRTLIWLGNQRAIEFHPSLSRLDQEHAHELIIDLDPPTGVDPAAGFVLAARTAQLVRQALEEAGLAGQVKTSGAKGVHIRIPIVAASHTDAAAATRALAERAARLDPELATTEFVRQDRGDRVFVDSTRAAGATLVSAWSPRARPGLPVSFPVAWEDLTTVEAQDFTVRTVPGLVAGADPWRAAKPEPRELPHDLIAHGHTIPIARVQAMHAGLRKARRAKARDAGE